MREIVGELRHVQSPVEGMAQVEATIAGASSRPRRCTPIAVPPTWAKNSSSPDRNGSAIGTLLHNVPALPKLKSGAPMIMFPSDRGSISRSRSFQLISLAGGAQEQFLRVERKARPPGEFAQLGLNALGPPLERCDDCSARLLEANTGIARYM
jgi:hypothetical protein